MARPSRAGMLPVDGSYPLLLFFHEFAGPCLKAADRRKARKALEKFEACLGREARIEDPTADTLVRCSDAKRRDRLLIVADFAARLRLIEPIDLPEPGGPLRWRDYQREYLLRLSLLDVRHYQTGRDITERFTRYMDPGGDLLMEQIDGRLFGQYLARRKLDPGHKGETLAISTLNKEIAYLNSCFGCAGQPTQEKPDRLGMMPADWVPPRMKLLRTPRRRPVPVSMPTLKRVLDACRYARQPKLAGCDPAHWWQTFYLLALVTGLRCEALLEVPRPSDEDLDANRFPLPATNDKAGNDRVFWLPPMLVSMIHELPSAPGERLFGWPFSRRHFYQVLHAWQSEAGIPLTEHALPHALKRTKGTLLTAQGCPLPLVSQELSHSNMQITMDYYIGSIAPERVSAVESMFAGLPIPEDLRNRFEGRVA